MKEVIIFGASKLGEIAYNVLKDKYNICFFSDNNAKKWGTKYCCREVISPEEIYKYKKSLIIIASMHYMEIRNQLKEMNVKNDIYLFDYCDVKDNTYLKRYSLTLLGKDEGYNDIVLNIEFKKSFLKNYLYLYKEEGEFNTKIIPNKSKKILIFAYIFPPIGGAGVQRTLKFVKYLNEFGYTPTVITVGKGFLSEPEDYSLMEEIPNDIEVIRIDQIYTNSEQLEKKQIKQLVNTIYGLIDNEEIMKQFIREIQINHSSLLVPDNQVLWVIEVLKYINSKVDISKFSCIYTTSSPYSTHILGYYLKKTYNNIKWVADFRDQWTINPYFRPDNKLICSLESEMEKSIVKTADKVLQSTRIASDNYRQKYTQESKKIYTITNGFDEDDFCGVLNENSDNKKFIITFTGTLYKNMLPYNFILAFNELIDERNIDKNKIEIHFWGKIDESLKEKINIYDKYNIIYIHSYIKHSECIRVNCKSNILYLPVGEEEYFNAVFPGKIFEYIRLKVPILALAPKDSVVSELLDDTKSGKVFSYNDLVGIKKFILMNYKMWKSNSKYDEFNINEIMKYERKKLTKNLINIIEEINI